MEALRHALLPFPPLLHYCIHSPQVDWETTLPSLPYPSLPLPSSEVGPFDTARGLGSAAFDDA